MPRNLLAEALRNYPVSAEANARAKAMQPSTFNAGGAQGQAMTPDQFRSTTGLGANGGLPPSSKAAPPPPNYREEAQLESMGRNAGIAGQTQANRPNINTALGYGQQWSQGPDGSWQLSGGFNGGMGEASNAYMGQLGALAQQQAPGVDWASLGQMPTGDGARQQAIDSAYGQATSRLDPQFAQRESALRSQLLQQGLDPTSEAFRAEMGGLGRERNDAYSSAMNGAIGQGTAAGQAVFQQGMMGRQQSLAEMLRRHDMPGQEQSRLLGSLGAMQGFTQTPSFMGAGAMGAPAYLQAAQMLGNYNIGEASNAQQAGADAMSGATAGIGALAGLAPLLLSDERAKTGIVRYEEEALPGVPYASWEYIASPGRRCVGVIAQDLERVAPQYVVELGGVKHVDYSFLWGAR